MRLVSGRVDASSHRRAQGRWIGRKELTTVKGEGHRMELGAGISKMTGDPNSKPGPWVTGVALQLRRKEL